MTLTGQGQQYLNSFRPNPTTNAPVPAGAPAVGYADPGSPGLPYRPQPNHAFGPFPPHTERPIHMPPSFVSQPATAMNLHQFAQQPGGALPGGYHGDIARVSLVPFIGFAVLYGLS